MSSIFRERKELSDSDSQSSDEISRYFNEVVIEYVNTSLKFLCVA